MNTEVRNFTRGSFPLMNSAHTPVRYTASYSSRLEAALDREWEANYFRNGKLFSTNNPVPTEKEGGMG